MTHNVLQNNSEMTIPILKKREVRQTDPQRGYEATLRQTKRSRTRGHRTAPDPVGEHEDEVESDVRYELRISPCIYIKYQLDEPGSRSVNEHAAVNGTRHEEVDALANNIHRSPSLGRDDSDMDINVRHETYKQILLEIEYHQDQPDTTHLVNEHHEGPDSHGTIDSPSKNVHRSMSRNIGNDDKAESDPEEERRLLSSRFWQADFVSIVRPMQPVLTLCYIGNASD